MTITTTESKISIPTTYLPDDWREQGMTKFSCGKTKVERIVYGLSALTKKSIPIFNFYVELAEEGKRKHTQLVEKMQERAEALNQ